MNLNDAQDRGWGSLVQRVIRAFPRSFLLRLSGYGDADMINFFDDDGRRVPACRSCGARAASRSAPTSRGMTEMFGAKHFVPFSSFHRYQRTDSAWANAVHHARAPSTHAASPPIAWSCCPRSCATTARPTRGRRSIHPAPDSAFAARGVRRRLVGAARARRRRGARAATSRGDRHLATSPRPHALPGRRRGARWSSTGATPDGRSPSRCRAPR